MILQHDTPEDFVIATGEQHTVKDFTEKAFAGKVPALMRKDMMYSQVKCLYVSTPNGSVQQMWTIFGEIL